MKIQLDSVKERLIAEGAHYGEAHGRAWAETKQVVLDWIIDRGYVLVVFGPPGSGKSKFLSSIREDEKTLILEISGVNAGHNKFLMSLPESRVEYVCIMAEEQRCLDVIAQRPPGLLDIEGSLDKISAIVKTWFARYNDGSDWAWKLPDQRRIHWR